jgi:hypothetical protein
MAGQASFIRDDPDSLSADAFGHRDYTDVLVSILEDETPPPTVGLFGPWGVGKSTIIGGVQRQLKGREVGFVYLDTWRYEGDPLRRQFLIEAAKQLDRAGKLKGGYSPEKELDELHIDRQEIKESLELSLVRFAKATLIGALFAVVALILLFAGVFEDVLSGDFGTSVLASVVAFTLGTFAGLFSQAIVVRPTTVTHKALQDPDRFAEKFAALLKALRPPRLVVAIDNLDRCSPEKAVEMLGTIKTYLEPVVAGGLLPRSEANEAVDKEVVFLIAVDDAALRRHLVAQEQARSAHHGELAVRRYVDEYLAKFFSARLPIRPILLDDMRGYVEGHMQPLAEARGLDKAQTAALISLVASALRRNPRGVKQFRNDLESRLRLLEEREQMKDAKRGIDPPISGEVTMVAKLALIETEWPDAFARLQEDPRLLERWTGEAALHTEVDWNSDEGLSDGEDSGDKEEVASRAAERRAFGDFIRLSTSTSSKHLRAMLSLKQSQVELELPGYSEFREAIVNGDSAAVEAVLGEADEKAQEKLAARVPEFLRAEIKRGYLDYARVIVEGMISIEAFNPFEDARRETLAIAVETPAVRSQLLSLDPAAVLGYAALLNPLDRPKLFEPYLARLLDAQYTDEVRLPIAGPLGSHASNFSSGQKKRVREALGGEMKSSFSLYLPVVRNEPKLLPVAAAEVAAAALGDPRGTDEPPPLTERPEPLEVVELGLRDPSINLEKGVLELITRLLRAYAGQESVLEAELSTYVRLLDPLEITTEDLWSELARAVEVSWNEMPVSLWPEGLRLADIAVERADEETRTAVSQAVADVIFADSEQGLALAAALGTPPASFEHPFVARLTSLSGQPARWRAACEALESIDEEEFPQRLANAFHSLFSAGHFEEAEVMLDVYEQTFEKHPALLANAATPVLVERASADQPTPANLLARLSEITSDDQLDELANAFAARLGGPEGSAIPDLLDQLREHGVMRLRLSIAHKAIAGMSEGPEPAPAPQVAVACRQIDQLPPEDQRLLAAGLAVRLRTHLDQALQIAGNVSSIRGISAEPAKELIEALVDAESAISDEGTRRQLLSAANTIRGRRNSLATRAFRKRLDVLAGSDHEFDRELSEQFLALLDS